MKEDSGSQLTLTNFQAAWQTRFRLQGPADTRIELLLVETRAVGATAAGAECKSFTILFRGPADPLLPQGIYSLAHDGLGTFDLFMVPVGRDKSGCCYEAVFNR